ncbi:DNA/RNA-binding protein KIN17, putative [Plasmodium vivax]|nr:DNA/RNA-binding protein KIN17, putative [Plasmodium vivax]
MPRAEPGTPKWLANKMKAKGLQKLKWYCQMCEKQCRDENGFKCHRLSETHQRQMQIFCQDANKFMDDYSSMFEKEFMRLMKTKYCRTRILANTVYTNMISDKTHIHMNATVWVTLTDFVLYLGKTGKCKIEETERGWYIEYIDREKIEREKAFEQRKKIEYSYEELKEKKINEAIEEAKKTGKFIQSEYTGLNKKSDEKIVISSIKATRRESSASKAGVNVLIAKALSKGEEGKGHVADSLPDKRFSVENDVVKGAAKKRPLSSIELLLLENEAKKRVTNTAANLKNQQNSHSEMEEKQQEKDEKGNPPTGKQYSWLCKNIVVKIIDRKHKYCNHKGVIVSVPSDERDKCEIQLNNSEKKKTSAHQKQLQTVIPKIGRHVLILRGQYRGLRGEVKQILPDEESALVAIFDKHSGKVTTEERFLFDDISKLHER